jgi:hypothetical protein
MHVLLRFTVYRLSCETLSRLASKWVRIQGKFAQYHYKMVEDVTAKHRAYRTVLHGKLKLWILQTERLVFSNRCWTKQTIHTCVWNLKNEMKALKHSSHTDGRSITFGTAQQLVIRTHRTQHTAPVPLIPRQKTISNRVGLCPPSRFTLVITQFLAGRDSFPINRLPATILSLCWWDCLQLSVIVARSTTHAICR